MTLGDHLPGSGLQGEQGPGHVDGEQPVIAFPRDLDDGGQVEQGGIVDQDVELAGGSDHLGDSRVDGHLVGNVHGQGVGALAQFLGRFTGSFDIDVGDGHPCAFPQVGLGEGLADTARAPVIRALFPSSLFMVLAPIERLTARCSAQSGLG